MSVTIYGASDDLIEIEGDIDDEFSPNGEDDTILGFSDGTVLRIRYDEQGIWRINLVSQLDPTAAVSIVSCPEDDEDNYTDRATVASAIHWVVAGSQFSGRGKLK